MADPDAVSSPKLEDGRPDGKVDQSSNAVVDWAVDPDNPRTWPVLRKAGTTAIVSGIGFVSTMAASIYSPGHDDVVREFGVSTTVALLPLSFYNLGMAAGP